MNPLGAVAGHQPAGDDARARLTYGQKADAVRAAVRRSIVARLLFACFVAIVFMLQPSLDQLSKGRRVNWRYLFQNPGVTPADATVVVVGLATVVAAISIALVALTSQVNDRHRGLDARASDVVWAEYTSLASATFAVLAAALGMTRYVVASAPERILAVILAAVGIASVLLSSAVTSWVGREYAERVKVDLLITSVRAHLQGLAAGVSRQSASRVYAAYAGFVALCAVLPVALMILTAFILARLPPRFLTPAVVQERPWSVATTVLIVTITSAGICVFLTQLCIVCWDPEVAAGWAHQWLSRTVRASLLGGFTFLTLITAIQFRHHLPNAAGVLDFWLGAVAIPGLLLFLARTRKRGPALFALRLLMRVDIATIRRLEAHPAATDNGNTGPRSRTQPA